MTRGEFMVRGKTWPLTVERGYVGCAGRILYFEDDQAARYALNGSSNALSKFGAIEDIWAWHSLFHDYKGEVAFPDQREHVPLNDLIDAAKSACGSSAE